MKYLKKFSKIYEEVSDQVYSKILNEYPNYRIVMNPRTGNSDTITYIPVKEQKEGMKPNGLWYSFGTEWIDWVRDNMPEWEKEEAFVLKVDESRILKIKTFVQLLKFENDYVVKDEMFYGFNCPFNINWPVIAEKWGGIEINPYIWSARPRLWYSGWDVASGCVWGEGMVLNIKKIE